MSILQQCECGKRIKVAEANVGKRTKCPACGRVFRIEDPNHEEAVIDDEAPADDFKPAREGKTKKKLAGKKKKRRGFGLPSMSAISIMGVDLTLGKCLVGLALLVVLGGGLFMMLGGVGGSSIKYEGKTTVQWLALVKTDTSENVDAAFEKLPPDPKAIDWLLNALEDKKQKPYATILLEKFGTNECKVIVTRLTARLGNQGQGQKWCVVLLGLAGPDAKTAIPQLKQIMDTDKTGLRYDAATALGRIGPDALPILLEKAKQGQPNDRLAGLKGIEAMGPQAKDAVPHLIEMLKDNDKVVVATSAQTLAAIGKEAEAALPQLIAMVKADGGNNPGVVAGLAKFPPTSQVPLADLMDLLNYQHREVQLWAIACCGEMGKGAADAVPTLEQKLATTTIQLENLKVQIDQAMKRFQERASAPSVTRELNAAGQVVSERKGGGAGASDSELQRLRSQAGQVEQFAKAIQAALAKVKGS